MKTALYKSPLPPGRLLVVKDLEEPYFDPYWHFHAEYQLFVVIKGSGTRFIGDSISSFGPGDMVFSGPNLPHLWRCDDSFFQKKKEKATRGIVVYFSEGLLSNEMLQCQEAQSIRKLYDKAARGMEIQKALSKTLRQKMEDLICQSGFQQVLTLLSILYQIASSDEVVPIASVGYSPILKAADTALINRVQNYIFENFKSSIRLTEAADIAHMSPSSFCRYFQRRTHKKFSQFVSELRIGHACQMLQKGEGNISQIAFSSGFPTLSNFNKKFREITGKTPREYREMYNSQ